MRSILCVVAVIITFAVPPSFEGAIAQPAPETGSPENTEPAKEIVVDPTAGDAQIAGRLQRILEASGWFGRVSVDVREGIAFIDGTTETDDRKEWASALARKTQDVVAVVNRMQIEPQIRWDWTPAWRELQNLVVQLQQMLPLLLIAAIILLISWYAAKGVGHLAQMFFQSRVQSPLLRSVISRAIAVPVFLVGLYLVLQLAGLTRLALTVLGGTGVLGIILGFAFRDIAENFLASLLLSIRNPFQAGDLIEVAGMRGSVRNLNTRSTILLTADGNHVRIPNATVFKSIITNFTSNASRRGEFSVGIGYDDSVSKAQKIILDEIAEHDVVLPEPPPMVLVGELGASTVTLRIYFWYDGRKYLDVKVASALMRRVKHALLAGGVSMPDEAREVIFPQGLPIYRAEQDETKGRQSLSDATPPDTADADARPTAPGEGTLVNDAEVSLTPNGSPDGPEADENLLDTHCKGEDGKALNG